MSIKQCTAWRSCSLYIKTRDVVEQQTKQHMRQPNETIANQPRTPYIYTFATSDQLMLLQRRCNALEMLQIALQVSPSANRYAPTSNRLVMFVCGPRRLTLLPEGPPRESAAQTALGRVLVPFAFDFWVARAPIFGGDVIHDAGDMLAAAPPGGLVCLSWSVQCTHLQKRRALYRGAGFKRDWRRR